MMQRHTILKATRLTGRDRKQNGGHIKADTRKGVQTTIEIVLSAQRRFQRHIP